MSTVLTTALADIHPAFDAVLRNALSSVIQQVTPQVEKRKQLTQTAFRYCRFRLLRAYEKSAGEADRSYLIFRIESFVGRLTDGRLVKTRTPIIWQWNTLPMVDDDLARDAEWLKDLVADPFTWVEARLPRGVINGGYYETHGEALLHKHVISRAEEAASKIDEMCLANAKKRREDHARYLATWTEEKLDRFEGPDCLGTPIESWNVNIAREGMEPIYLEA